MGKAEGFFMPESAKSIKDTEWTKNTLVPWKLFFV